MKETPLLPEGDASDNVLFFVVCTLCFLAALSALFAKSTYGAAEQWTTELEGELTIRLRGTDQRMAEQAKAVIEGVNGVISARVLSAEETAALLEPSFGTRELPAALPLPRLIAVQTDSAMDAVPDTLETVLSAQGFDALIDAHSDWAGDLRTALGRLRLVAFSIVGLLTATALAVIMFATHSAMLARRDIIELLNLSGAHDRFIAELFERRFWVLGLKSGALGACLALGVTAFLIFSIQRQGAQDSLMPSLSLDFTDLLLLILTPIIAGFAARLATRLTVLRSLKEEEGLSL